MSDHIVVSDGSELRAANRQSPLQLFKGPEDKIKARVALQDGSLYFATDTRKIYLDCDFTDSNDRVWHDRLAFGGSSGIYFSTKTFGEYDSAFPFEYSEVENVLNDEGRIVNVPQIDDIIIDTANGSFYRVVGTDDDTQYIQTERLTVAGGGGGGGGSGGGSGSGSSDGTEFMGRLITTSLAFASTSNEMPIQYLAFSETTVGDTEETQTKIRNGIELIIADVTTGQEIYRIELPQGETKNTLMTANIAPAIQAMVSQELILVNRLYRFGVRITDSLGNLSSAQ